MGNDSVDVEDSYAFQGELISENCVRSYANNGSLDNHIRETTFC